MRPLDWVMGPIQLVLLAYGLYQLAVSLAGLLAGLRQQPAPPPRGGRRHRFALVTAAHNEEAVIAPHVENLLRLDYPRDLYQVFIIADNCTDRTAAIARAAGATVLERRDDSRRGKGHALDWFFRWFLPGAGRRFDAVCLFDADNLVAPDFLIHMDAELRRGHRCVQAYIDSKNPLDSWVSCCYSIMFWTMNRLYQFARHRLGLSAYLGGTGMCIGVAELRRFGWSAHGLTEDLEFTVKLVRAGERVWWCHGARVYDEKPVTFAPTWRQRLRWLKGHWLLFAEHFLPLLGAAWRQRSWQRLDVALHLLNPLVLVLTLVSMAAGSLAPLLSRPDVDLLQMPWVRWLPTWAWVTLALIGYLWPLVGMLLERVPARAYLYYAAYIPYAMTWMPISVVGWWQRHDRRWSHTRHTRALRLEDLPAPPRAAAR